MKTIEIKKTPSIHIPAFKIESTDFIKIIEDIQNDGGNISIITGKYSDDKRYEFESLDEIKESKSLIITPLELNIDDMKLNLQYWSDDIHLDYNHENSHRAKSFAEQLSHYKPWYGFLAKGWFDWAVLGLIFSLFFAFLYWSNIDSSYQMLLIPIFISYTYTALLNYVNSRLKTTKAVIFFAPRETFRQRNQDTILVGGIIAVITIILTLGGPALIKSYKTGFGKNEPIIQQQDN